MIKLFLRQILFVVSTFIGVSIITFSLLKLSPVTVDINESNTTDSAYTEQKNEDNIVQQYFRYFGNILQGDLGTSSQSGAPVTDEFLSHLPASVE